MTNLEIPDELNRLGLPELPDALPAPVTDAHTHLDVTNQHSGIGVETLLDAARAVGVTRVAQIGCDVASSRWAEQIARERPQVVAAVALHPNDAARIVELSGDDALDVDLAEIDRLAGAGPHVRAIGETGLDYFRTRTEAGHEAQRRSFAAHIAMAKAHGLTLAIHDRDAHTDVLAMLDAEGAPERVIMHCYSGDAEFARECLGRGFWLSFAGTVTFKPNQHLRDALGVTPLDRVLVETDAPFLAPVPLRGRPNSSYLMPLTVEFLAECKGVGLGEMCEALQANATRAYGGEWGDDA